MLVVEGPDLVGKTTFAASLAARLNELGWPHLYRHFGKQPECWAQDPVRLYRLSMTPYVVQDRFHLSEVVYAAVEGPARRPHLGPSSYEQVQREFRNHWEGYLVVVTAEPALLEERYAERDRPEAYELEDVLRANELYEEACRTGRLSSVGVVTPVDLWVRETADEPWPSLEQLSMSAYTARMARSFDYPGSRRA